ncbi:MAG: hypothetical protein P8M71_02420 [Pseudomonadales bacterium]|nr:hypothetical protein [Pseudomonadales bacterium]
MYQATTTNKYIKNRFKITDSLFRSIIKSEARMIGINESEFLSSERCKKRREELKEVFTLLSQKEPVTREILSGAPSLGKRR